MCLLPKSLCNRQRLDLEPLPPGQFIARLMQLSVMTAAERHREFIADFHADPPWLSKTQMMRIARLPPADQAGLGGDEFQVRLIAQPLGFGDRELALVDWLRPKVGVVWRERRRGCWDGFRILFGLPQLGAEVSGKFVLTLEDERASQQVASARLVASVSAALRAISCTSPGESPRPSPVPWPSLMMVVPAACTVSRTRAT
jgi:hypothetical protein